MKHGRLPWMEPGEMDEAQGLVYRSITSGPRNVTSRRSPLTDAAGRLEGPFNAMLFSPKLGMALQQLGAAIRYESDIADRAREIAILEVARANRSDYEWQAHEQVGRIAGLSDEELQAIKNGASAPTLTADEALVRELAQSLLTAGDLSDSEFEGAKRALGYSLLTEIVAIVGYYSLLAMSLRAWRVPLPGGVEGVFDGQTHEPGASKPIS
jgi:4-carboxymuconolactone decarboxylase